MPTGVVEDQVIGLAPLLGNFLRQDVEERLEHESVAVGNDHADELSALRFDGTDDIAANVTAMIADLRARSPLHPFKPGSRVSLEARFVAEEHSGFRIVEKPDKPHGKGFAFIFPFRLIFRFRKSTGNLAHVFVLVKISNQSPVTDVELLLGLQPTGELGDRPMVLTRQCRIINNRQNELLNLFSLHLARTTASGVIGDTIDALFIEARYPELQTALRNPSMLASQLKCSAAEQQVNRIETLLRLLVGTAIDSCFQLDN